MTASEKARLLGLSRNQIIDIIHQVSERFGCSQVQAGRIFRGKRNHNEAEAFIDSILDKAVTADRPTRQERYFPHKDETYVQAKCPLCEKMHQVLVYWTGNGTPRIYCDMCRVRLVNETMSDDLSEESKLPAIEYIGASLADLDRAIADLDAYIGSLGPENPEEALIAAEVCHARI